MARLVVGLFCAAALAARAAAGAAAACAEEEDAVAGAGQVTLLQTGRDFSASPADGEHSLGDLASALPPPAGTGGREASAPAAGGLASGPPAAGQNATAPLGGGQPAAGRGGHGAAAAPAAGRRKLLTQMYRRSGAATWTSGWGEKPGEFPELLVQRTASAGFDWSPQVLTAVNIAVILIILGAIIGGAVAWFSTRDPPRPPPAPPTPTARQERLAESLFGAQH